MRRSQVQDLIADGHTAPPFFLRPGATYHGVGKILDREIRVRPIGRLDPAAEGRIVSGVQPAHAAPRSARP